MARVDNVQLNLTLLSHQALVLRLKYTDDSNIRDHSFSAYAKFSEKLFRKVSHPLKRMNT